LVEGHLLLVEGHLPMEVSLLQMVGGCLPSVEVNLLLIQTRLSEIKDSPLGNGGSLKTSH
jgi:hypothetical protein